MSDDADQAQESSSVVYGSPFMQLTISRATEVHSFCTSESEYSFYDRHGNVDKDRLAALAGGTDKVGFVLAQLAAHLVTDCHWVV